MRIAHIILLGLLREITLSEDKIFDFQKIAQPPHMAYPAINTLELSKPGTPIQKSNQEYYQVIKYSW